LTPGRGFAPALRSSAAAPHLSARMVAASPSLPCGAPPPGEAFFRWSEFSQRVPDFSAGFIVQTATTTPLPPEVVAAYDAPFPDESYKAGARAFPLLVPAAPDDPAAPANRKAWQALAPLAKPVLAPLSDG